MSLKLLPITALALAGAGGMGAFRQAMEVAEEFKGTATLTVEMQGIADALAGEYASTETLPNSETEFHRFLNENLREAKGGDKRDKTRDVWGTHYKLFLNTSRRGIVVRSAGPDKAWKSEDDLRVEYNLAGIGPVPVAGSLPLEPPDFNRSPGESEDGPGRGQQKGKGKAKGTPRSRDTADEDPGLENRIVDFEKRQAERGLPGYQFDLGKRYLTGDGVKQNLAEGIKWIEAAAENGHAEAVETLGQIKPGAPEPGEGKAPE